MANPSTQVPSNAITTEIIFAEEFSQATYTLLEIPTSLESFLKENENNTQLSFQIRGLETDTAVLCTPTQTFSVQRAHTSNTLMPIAPIRKQTKKSSPHVALELSEDAPTLPMDMDFGLDMDMDTAEEEGEKHDKEERAFGQQMVLDILDSVLDLIPISPRLERLSELLGLAPFEGWAQEVDRKGYIYTWEHLQSAIQASDEEIKQWLKDHHACFIDGHWRLFKQRFMYDILQEMLMAVNVLEMTVQNIEAAALCQAICEENTEQRDSNGIEAWMVKHCLESFSEEDTDLPPGHFKVSGKKMCVFMGVHILSTVERGNRWVLSDFMRHWQQSLHNQFEPDLAYLAGECIVDTEKSPDQRYQPIKYIRYFSKQNLPNDPASRFAALFEIKPKWEAHEIRPFLRDLVLDEKKLDVLLLKHARSAKQPGGEVVYNSRIIK
ncbi:Sister chromatid cohesion protein DCC1 [Podila minutissima]|nr:Sister chromatid cohesion protein DCC1 [Podila minutissima]